MRKSSRLNTPRLTGFFHGKTQDVHMDYLQVLPLDWKPPYGDIHTIFLKIIEDVHLFGGDQIDGNTNRSQSSIKLTFGGQLLKSIND